jgi:hypothetical protein
VTRKVNWWFQNLCTDFNNLLKEQTIHNIIIIISDWKIDVVDVTLQNNVEWTRRLRREMINLPKFCRFISSCLCKSYFHPTKIMFAWKTTRNCVSSHNSTDYELEITGKSGNIVAKDNLRWLVASRQKDSSSATSCSEDWKFYKQFHGFF